MRRRAALWILLGWLLAIGTDQLVGYEYTAETGNPALGIGGHAFERAKDGWEPVPYVSYPQADQLRDYDAFVFMRRRAWRGWVEAVRSRLPWH